MCSLSHMALSVLADGNVALCGAKDCIRMPAPTSSYEYIRLSEGLERMIADKNMGPIMYEYYQKGIRDALKEDAQEDFVDFSQVACVIWWPRIWEDSMPKRMIYFSLFPAMVLTLSSLCSTINGPRWFFY